MVEFQYAFSRLEKLKKTIEQLIKTNQQLSAANSKLRQQLTTFETREAARERVIRSLDKRDTECLTEPGSLSTNNELKN